MKTKSKLLTLLALNVLLFAHISLAHDRIVHQLITANAVSSAIKYSSCYSNFLNTINPSGLILVLKLTDAGGATPGRWMTIGSAQEDNFFEDQNGTHDAGGARPMNHFYNPLNG
jgi:hypothetical protein